MSKVDDIIEKALALPEPWIAKIILGFLEADSYSNELGDAIYDMLDHGHVGSLKVISEQPIGESGRDEDQERADYRSSQ